MNNIDAYIDKKIEDAHIEYKADDNGNMHIQFDLVPLLCVMVAPVLLIVLAVKFIRSIKATKKQMREDGYTNPYTPVMHFMTKEEELEHGKELRREIRFSKKIPKQCYQLKMPPGLNKAASNNIIEDAFNSRTVKSKPAKPKAKSSKKK